MEHSLAQLRKLRAALPTCSQAEDNVRAEMLREARQLMLNLETPNDVIVRVGFQIWETIVLDVAANMGILQALSNSRKPMTAEDLAKISNGELLLVQRLLRCLVAYGAVDQTTTGYTSTTICNTFATRKGTAAIHGCLELLTSGWVTMPQALEKQGYRLEGFAKPENIVHGNVRGMQIKSFFEVMSLPQYVEDFGIFMSSFNEGHQDWLDLYPVEERLIKGSATDADAVFMVDIGGYHGTQVGAVRKRFPGITSRFVNQDLGDVLPKEAQPGVENMAHNFFQEQPIKGARFYYLRYVPHDWPQDQMVNILQRLREAMEPGYSKIIVNEWIVPDKNPGIFMAVQDLNMLSIGNGEERSESRHRDYIERAGLQITGIWDPKDGMSEAVIECELA